VDLTPDGAVENRLQRTERGHQVPVDAHQDVARLQHTGARGAREHRPHHQHAGALRIRLAHRGLHRTRQPQPLELVEGGIVEHRVQRAARDRLACLDQPQRAFHQSERQVEARGGIGGASGVERHHLAFDVDHR
jgi:hypothetical protein